MDVTKLYTGQRFIKGEEYYMLCQVKARQYCLISLEDGNRWREYCSIEEMRNQIIKEGFKEALENRSVEVILNEAPI